VTASGGKMTNRKNSCTDGAILRWLYLTILDGIVDARDAEQVEINPSKTAVNFVITLQDGARLEVTATIKHEEENGRKTNI
jgi:hypothetical protein